MRSFLPVLLVACLSFALGCKKDLSNEKSSIKPPVISTAAAPITAPLQGNVFDENGQPVAGVTISVGSQTVTTDARGYFRMDKASLDRRASLLTGEKAGYFKIVKSFAATPGVNYQRIKLLKKTLVGTVTGSSGGTVNLGDGGSVTLPAGGVVKASDNSPYTGTVNVYAAVIDPTASDFPETIPGSLMASDSAGRRVMLQSYGMLAVALESPAAEPLQVAPEKMATLSFTIPADLRKTAPASIPLWYINDAGLWQEQGRAYRSGDIYSGEVSHFSFWNCDTAFSTVRLNLTVKDSKDRPVQYASVRLRSSSYGSSYGYTDSLGRVSGLIPFNDEVAVSISSGNYCTVSSVARTIGPFTESAAVEITADDLSLTDVSGRILSCDDKPSAKGAALIYYRNNRYIAPVDPSGAFHLVLTRCGAGEMATLIGIDSSGKQQGSPKDFPVSSSSVEVGDIKACGVSTSQFVNYTLDGVSYRLNDANSTAFEAFDTVSLFFLRADNKTLENSIFFILPDEDPNKSPLPNLSFKIGKKQFGQTAPGGITVSLTNFPQTAGEYFEGSFAGYFSDGDKQSHQVSCTFRIQRDERVR